MDIDRVFELMDDDSPQEEWQEVEGYEKRPEYSDNNIVDIIEKEIGDVEKQISIAGESDSQYIVFEMNRYYDGIDITQKNVQIHYETESGGGENYPVNVQCTSSKVRFGWVIPKAAVQKAGKIKVCLYAFGASPLGNDYILKSAPKIYEVKEGINPGSGIVVDDEWYLAFVKEMNQLVAEAKAASEEAQKASEVAKTHAYKITVQGNTIIFAKEDSPL